MMDIQQIVEMTTVALHFLTFATVIGYLLCLSRLFRYLEQHAPDTYDSLGRPTLLLRNSLESNYKVIRFLFSASAEAPLKNVCRYLFIAGAVGVVLTGAGFTMLFILY
jgi:hypothetical protein